MNEQRTLQQNKSLYKWFELLAEELNDAGLTVEKVLKKSVEIEWTKDLIKGLIWHPVQKAQLGKKSTTLLTTKEVSQIYEVLNRHLGEKLGVFVDFPHIPETDENNNDTKTN